jgi:hypothetical protein
MSKLMIQLTTCLLVFGLAADPSFAAFGSLEQPRQSSSSFLFLHEALVARARYSGGQVIEMIAGSAPNGLHSLFRGTRTPEERTSTSSYSKERKGLDAITIDHNGPSGLVAAGFLVLGKSVSAWIGSISVMILAGLGSVWLIQQLRLIDSQRTRSKKDHSSDVFVNQRHLTATLIVAALVFVMAVRAFNFVGVDGLNYLNYFDWEQDFLSFFVGSQLGLIIIFIAKKLLPSRDLDPFDDGPKSGIQTLISTHISMIVVMSMVEWIFPLLRGTFVNTMFGRGRGFTFDVQDLAAYMGGMFLSLLFHWFFWWDAQPPSEGSLYPKRTSDVRSSADSHLFLRAA